ncbi:MAG TPA: hypothetical protein VER38_06105 [Candidatus Eisenbacteria bacterium]|nr:hypothetical protein [Candidatus Eisenbacteria bacterium]
MSAEAFAHAAPHGERMRVAPLSVPMGVRALFGLMIVIGIVTFLLEVSTDPTRAYAAWLHNYWVFLCLGLGGTFFTAIHYLTGATWSVAVRRIADAFSSYVPIAFLLFVVVAIGIPHLYIWSSPAATQGEGAKLIAKNGYLSSSLYILRNVACLALWSFFSWFFVRNSTRQDETRDLSLTKRNVKISAVFLVTFALTFTLVSFDLLMSLEPTWYSTIFGVYCWAGLWQSVLAAIAIVTVILRRQGALSGVVSRAHYHDLGKYVFAFGVFWTYIAFSQFMLIWYANLPEEIEWMIHRIYTGWGAVIIAVTVLKWVIPFFVLMPVRWKENETVLLTVAAGVILGQWLDMYWVIYPAFSPEHAVLSWNEIGVAVGFIGLFCWKVQSFLARHPVAPHGDPDFPASVRFHA